jgi:hypothetical protein
MQKKKKARARVRISRITAAASNCTEIPTVHHVHMRMDGNAWDERAGPHGICIEKAIITSSFFFLDLEKVKPLI